MSLLSSNLRSVYPAMNSVGHGHRIPRMTVRPSRISPQHTRLRMSEAGNSAI